MGIAARTGQDAVRACILLCLTVVSRQRVACIEDLEDIDLTSYLVQLVPRHPAPPNTVEGVWNVHDTALLPNALNGLQVGEPWRNPFVEKEPDHLPGLGLDLFTWNDEEWRLLLKLESPSELVMIGEGEGVQSGLRHGAHDLLKRGPRVLGVAAMAVEIDADHGTP